MDIIKQKRITAWVIVLLVFLNVSTIALLWFGRPTRRAGGPPPSQTNPQANQGRLQQLLEKELGFDQTQIEKFLQLREEHSQQSNQIEEQVRLLKKQMFDQVLENNPHPTLSDSLLKLTQEKQAEIEKLTFQYFLGLKNICTPEQQKALKMLMHEMLRPPNAPPGGGGPRHPPEGERPPRRPLEN